MMPDDAAGMLDTTLTKFDVAPATLDGDLGGYRWGEFMLSATDAAAALGETDDWAGLRDRFADVAAEPEYHLDPARVDFLRLLPPSPTEVLDVGCGLGLSSEEIARAGHAVVGLERSRFRAAFTNARLTRQGLPGAALCGDMASVSVPGDAFGAIVMLGVFEWFGHGKPDANPDEEQQRGLDQVARTLRSGGRALVVIENRYGFPFLLGQPEVHVRKRFVGVAPRALARRPMLWGLDRPFDVYTHSLRHLRRMATKSGLALRTAFGTLPQYHRPSVYVPLIWKGHDVARSTIARGYESFAGRHEERYEARLLHQLHRLLPSTVAAAIAPGFVLELTKGTPTEPSVLEDAVHDAPVTMIGGGGVDGTTTLDAGIGSVVKLLRRPNGRWNAAVAAVERARHVLDASIPRHALTSDRVVIERIRGKPAHDDCFLDSLGTLARLHCETPTGERTAGDVADDSRTVIDPALRATTVPTATVHGDWLARNLLVDGARLGIIDWEHARTDGNGWADALWAVVRHWSIGPEAIRRYAERARTAPSEAEVALARGVIRARLPEDHVSRALERLEQAVAALG